MTFKSLFKGKFILEWIAANTSAALIVNGIAYLVRDLLLEIEWYPIVLVSFVASFITLQFLVLRKRVMHARLWMLSGVLSIIMGLITFVILMPEISSFENPLAFYTNIFVPIISLLVAQWLILGQEYHRSWLWILFNISGIIAATYIAGVIYEVVARMVWIISSGPVLFPNEIDVFSLFASIAVFGIVFGLITGIGLRIFFMKYQKT